MLHNNKRVNSRGRHNNKTYMKQKYIMPKLTGLKRETVNHNSNNGCLILPEYIIKLLEKITRQKSYLPLLENCTQQ